MNIGSKIVLFCVLVFAVGFTGGCVYSIGGEKIIKVAESPNTPEFQRDSGTETVHVDLGYVWPQTEIFWCPIYNSEGKYVGYINSDSKFLNLDANQLKRMAEVTKVNVSEPPKLSFWDVIGGKIAGFVVLLLVIIAYVVFGSD
jgi:hypothetical protein